MLANCTFAETLGEIPHPIQLWGNFYRVSQKYPRPGLQFVDFPSSHTTELRIMTIICAIITYTALLLRFMSRLLLVQTFEMDDYFIIAAGVSHHSALNHEMN
jgi:hypothetical protein